MCYAFSSPPALRRRGAVTKALQAVTRALRVVTKLLRVVTEPLLIVTSRYGVGWLRGACALQRHWLRSHASSEGLAPWVVPSALLPQGDSLWLAPSAHVCGRLLGREAGRGPTSWGYYSTPVRILQWGWGITWGDGFVLACALHQRRVCIGLRRYPARSTLQRF